MKVTVNGRPGQVGEGTTVADLLAEYKLDHVRVAVERNGRVVPRDQFDRVAVQDGDSLEVVTLVGGG